MKILEHLLRALELAVAFLPAMDDTPCKKQFDHEARVAQKRAVKCRRLFY